MTKPRYRSESEKRRYGPAVHSRAGEATRAERVIAPWLEAKDRSCLRCTTTFQSPHAGIRICPHCRQVEDHRSR